MPKRRIEKYKVVKQFIYHRRLFSAGRFIRFSQDNAEPFVKSGQIIKVDGLKAKELKAKEFETAKLKARELKASKLKAIELESVKLKAIELEASKLRTNELRVNELKSNRRRKRSRYIPSDSILGGPTDRWMHAGPYPIGQGHTAIVNVLKDGSHQKCFREGWIVRCPYMISSEARGLKVMKGIHAPRYITNDATSVTMSDAGVHLSAANMPDNWDAQIGSIILQLKEAGIRHNDIIPRNIMVKDGEIKLIDFSMSTLIGSPFPEPWPNQRLLKIIIRDGDEVMLRRAITYLLGRQNQWKEVSAAIAALGATRIPGSNTKPGWTYHDIPFCISHAAHRKNTLDRAVAMMAAYDFSGKSGLDLGCSVGAMSFWLNRFGATMMGVERDPQSVRVAKALQAYYGLKNITFIGGDITRFLYDKQHYDFVCYLSTFMWLLKEEGLDKAKDSLRRIGKMTDTLFFETSHGDAMAGGAVIKAGLNDKDKMNRLVAECTGLTNMKEVFVDKKWNNRRLVIFTR